MKGEPLLLARVVFTSNDPGLSDSELAEVVPHELEQRIRPDRKMAVGDARVRAELYKTLVVNTCAKAGTFSILLIPFRHGEKLPASTLDRSKMTLSWKDQSDTVVFDDSSAEKTYVSIIRDGVPIISIKIDRFL